MEYKRENLLNFFNVNNILFTEYEHKALFTVEQSKEMRGKIQGSHTKNLFLRDKKKKYFLLSCAEDKIIDLKKLRNPLSTNNLSFASSDRLKEVLGLIPGSVTPFGLINDKKKQTKFYLDLDLYKSDSINFHPLLNNFTVNMDLNNFYNFMKIINVELQIIDLKVYKLINYGN
tara:strand:- start:5134 stop:5652 length:519 start_codon:yes stop_codon:yes gene_type:complete